MKTTAFSVRVNTRSADENGLLVLVDGRLAAVLVELQDGIHGDRVGQWCIEAMFGAAPGRLPPSFDSVGEAITFVAEQVGAGPAGIPDEISALG